MSSNKAKRKRAASASGADGNEPKPPPPDLEQLHRYDDGRIAIPKGRGNRIQNHEGLVNFRQYCMMILATGMPPERRYDYITKNCGEFFEWRANEVGGWQWMKMDAASAKKKITQTINDLRKRMTQTINDVPKSKDGTDGSIPKFIKDLAEAELSENEKSRVLPFDKLERFDDMNPTITRKGLNAFVEILMSEDFTEWCAGRVDTLKKTFDKGWKKPKRQYETREDQDVAKAVSFVKGEDRVWKQSGVKEMNGGFMISCDEEAGVWKRHKKLHQGRFPDIPYVSGQAVKQYEERRRHNVVIRDTYFLLIHRGQAVHVDSLEEHGRGTRACCMYLSAGSETTVLYNMEGVKRSADMTWDYIRDTKIWEDAPESVFEHLSKDEHATDLLHWYGRALFATPDRRLKPIIADQFSSLTFGADTPHNAPASPGGDFSRLTMFMLLEDKKTQVDGKEQDEEKTQGAQDDKKNRDEETTQGVQNENKKKDEEKIQYSRDKLLLSFYEISKDNVEASEYLRQKFFDSYAESAMRDARDLTLNLSKELEESIETHAAKAREVYQRIKKKIQSEWLRKKAAEGAERTLSSLNEFQILREKQSQRYKIMTDAEIKSEKLLKHEKKVDSKYLLEHADQMRS